MVFFESHFTEMKYGWISGESGSSDPLLRWDIGGVSQWSTTWDAGVWHNVAYEIVCHLPPVFILFSSELDADSKQDFSGGTVAFWHSTGASPLTLTVPAVKASTSSNGEDWHLGVLELPVSGQADSTEDFYFSGVYIESGSLTTSVAGPGGVVASGSVSSSSVSSTLATVTKSATSSKAPVSSAPVVVSSSSSAAPAPVSSTAAAGNLSKYSQCGGQGWTGSGTCVSGTTCKTSNPYYSQCL